MFQNFNKNKKIKADNNLKLMSISAIILVVLFAYTIIKSDHAMQHGSYYIGMIFLFGLMILAFSLQKYKNKIQRFVPKNRFQKEVETSTVTKKEELVDDGIGHIDCVQSSISFKDVAGISDVKEELEEIVDFLNNPKKYNQYNVSLPKGVLLVGPPGVGKTLIARAVAGEADVPFFYQSGANFVHIYVGMGAKRVRELFNAAKAQAPSIVFIDEIDAIGKQRGIGSNDERESTLNELLTQMDGFSGNSGVIVIGATNKIEVLDEALLRAGRFDRRVFLTNPSKDDRKKILELYLKGKQYSFDLENLASDTSGFSSAALATLINESLLNMIKREGTSILDSDVGIAKQKVQFGKKQIHILTIQEKDVLATYQASKAVITQENIKLFDEGIKLNDLVYPSKKQLMQQILALLSGSVGVFILLEEEYIVFESEISEAHRIANNLVEKYKLANNIDEVINETKKTLQQMIISKKDEILRAKQILLKDEVIVF